MKEVDGRPFECTQCGKCCSWGGFVFLKKPDVERLSKNQGLEVDEFLKQFTTMHRNELVLKDVDGTPDCIFLKDKKCSVYKDRPEQCEDYPQQYDSRCPGFRKGKEGAMNVQYEEAVKNVQERFSGCNQDYEKAVSDNLFKELQSGVKTASVTSMALEDGIDAFFQADKIKIASLADLFSFDRVDTSHLIHKTTKDLWSIEADDDGGVQIMRLFNNDGDPIKG